MTETPDHADRADVPAWMAGWGHGSILPALVATGHAAAGFVLTGHAPTPALLLLVGAGTFLVYQLDRGLGLSPEDRVNRPARLRWMKTHRLPWLLSSILAAVTAGIAWWSLPGMARIITGAIALGALGYVLPILPGRRRIKQWFAAKLILLPAAWMVGTAWLPALSTGASWTTGLLGFGLYRFCTILPNFLLSDIPDRHGDLRAGVLSPGTGWPPCFTTRLCLGCLLAAGLMVPALILLGLPPLLLGIDALGLIGLGIMTRQPPRAGSTRDILLLDACTAWPWITWAAWYIIGA